MIMKTLMTLTTALILAASTAAYAKPMDKKYHPFVGNQPAQESTIADIDMDDPKALSDIAPAAGESGFEKQDHHSRQFKRH
jgi:hypothetical protein